MSNVAWIQAQWEYADYCQGVPTAFYLFSTPNPQASGYNPENFSNLPDIFKKLDNGLPYPYAYCGASTIYLPADSFCCLSSVDLAKSNGIQSGADIIITPARDLESTLNLHSPASANASTYCLLVNSNVSTKSNVFGYSSVLYLNNGNCYNPTTSINMSASCSSSVLSLYSDPFCKSLEVSYQLNSTDSTKLYSSTWGSYRARLFTFQSARMNVGWTTIQPYTEFVPGVKTAGEIIAILAIITSFSLLWGCLFNAGIQYLKRRTPLDLLSFQTIISWIISGILLIIMYYVSYPSCLPSEFTCTSFQQFSGVRFLYAVIILTSYSLNIAIATHTFHRVGGFSNIEQIAINVCIVTIGISLCLGLLIYEVIMLILSFQDNVKAYSSLYESLAIAASWKESARYFVVFMFVWDLLPMNVAFFRLVQKKKNLTFMNTVNEMLLIDKNRRFQKTNILQVLVIILYYILGTLYSTTLIFQNDRNVLGVVFIKFLLLASHSCLNISLTEAMKSVLIGRKNKKVKKKMELPSPTPLQAQPMTSTKIISNEAQQMASTNIIINEAEQMASTKIISNEETRDFLTREACL